MRKDHQIPPFGEVNPASDFDATALVLTYCIGDDQDPDEVIDIRARGDFRIDSILRDEIRAIALTDGLLPDDLDVQETRIPPQGIGMAAMFETWLQAMPPNILGSVVGGGIVAGCAKLWQKYHPKAPPQQPAVTSPLPPEDIFSKHAGGVIAQHYTIGETLTSLNLVITETHSAHEHSGTVDMCERDGRTFHVTISSPTHGWRVVHIIRIRPDP